MIACLVQPFFHMLANDIADQIGYENKHEIIATTIVSFALSSLLTGTSDISRFGDMLTTQYRTDFLPLGRAPLGFAHWFLSSTYTRRVRGNDTA